MEKLLQPLWVDSRVGSDEFRDALLRRGIPAKPTVLDMGGDFVFTGHGPEGDVEIAIERKTVPDLTDSLRSGRLQGRSAEDRGQLERMRKSYDIIFLLVEGSTTGDRFGRLFRGKGSHKEEVKGVYNADTLIKAMLTLMFHGGMFIWQTESKKGTVDFVCAVYRWFTDKQWDQHATMNKAIGTKTMVPLSKFREIVQPLPGIGIAGSAAVERFCMVDTPDGRHPSLTRLLRMTLSEWENLEEMTTRGPRRFGTAKAARIVEALRNLR
jgi:ERCC4-type nuclease